MGCGLDTDSGGHDCRRVWTPSLAKCVFPAELRRDGETMILFSCNSAPRRNRRCARTRMPVLASPVSWVDTSASSGRIASAWLHFSNQVEPAIDGRFGWT